MGIPLRSAAIGICVPENSAKNDKTERQTVLETVWRSAFLCICYQSTDL